MNNEHFGALFFFLNYCINALTQDESRDIVLLY